MSIKSKSFLIIICVVFIYILWVVYFNLNYGKIDIICGHIGDSITENAYQYRVDEYYILSEEEFEKKYSVEIDDKLIKKYQDVKILTVSMTIKKVYTNEKENYKFDLSNIYAQTLTYSQGISFNLFSLLNSEIVELNSMNDEAEVIIPYLFVKDVFSKRTWDNFEDQILKIAFNNAESTKKEIILKE